MRGQIWRRHGALTAYCRCGYDRRPGRPHRRNRDVRTRQPYVVRSPRHVRLPPGGDTSACCGEFRPIGRSTRLEPCHPSARSSATAGRVSGVGQTPSNCRCPKRPDAAVMTAGIVACRGYKAGKGNGRSRWRAAATGSTQRSSAGRRSRSGDESRCRCSAVSDGSRTVALRVEEDVEQAVAAVATQRGHASAVRGEGRAVWWIQW